MCSKKALQISDYLVMGVELRGLAHIIRLCSCLCQISPHDGSKEYYNFLLHIKS